MTPVYRAPGEPLEIPRPRPTFRPQLRALAIAGLVALIGFAVRALEHTARSPDTRLSPELVAFADALPFVLAATWIYAGWLVIRHAYWTVQHRTALVRSLYVGGSIVGHGAAVALLSGLLVIASPDWLFGPRAVASAMSPDRGSIGYLYGPGLLSGCSVYVRTGTELYVHRSSDSLTCPDAPASGGKIVWPYGSSTPMAVDAAGAPLAPLPPLSLFSFGGC